MLISTNCSVDFFSCARRCAIVALVKDTLEAVGKRLDASRYLAREPVMVATLFAVALVAFLAVTGLTHVYYAQRDHLGSRWSFAAAGQRLKSCNLQSASFTAPVTQSSLTETWERMKPRITPWGLRHHPDSVEPAMDLVFRIERETAASCGMPSETDTALVLIAKLHEGS